MRPTVRALLALTSIGMTVLACSEDGPVDDGRVADAPDPGTAEPGDDVASLLIGTWLGPEPGMTQDECENGTTEYTFAPDGTWIGRNVNVDECGGIFTIGGTYSTSGDDTLVFRFTRCPQDCSGFPDAPVSIAFEGEDFLTISDSTFTGTYRRQ